MPTIRIMVVDDHEVVRSGLKAILDPETDFEAVGEASSGTEALKKVPVLNPDVVLMDVRMEEMSGIEACRLIKSEHPEVNVLMLTSFSEEEAVMSAIMAGASAYLLKNVGRSELIKAIRGVAAGQNLLDPAVTKKVIEEVQQKIDALKVKSNFSIRPVLIHCNTVSELVEESGFFATIINFSEFLK